MAIPQEGTNQTQIVDVSSSGLRMESNQEFLAGEEIAIRVNKLVTFGVVRYCRELRPGWFLPASTSTISWPIQRKYRRA